MEEKNKLILLIVLVTLGNLITFGLAELIPKSDGGIWRTIILILPVGIILVIFGFFIKTIRQFLGYSFIKALTENLISTGQLYFDFDSHQKTIRLLGDSVVIYLLFAFAWMFIFAMIFFSLGIILARTYNFLFVRKNQSQNLY